MMLIVLRAGKQGIFIQKLEKIDASKIEERANRFGLNLTGNRVVTQRQIDELYINCGIEGGNERHFRFDAIHLHGVNGLSTREIFEYLEDYKPVSLEWLDDLSCNIVFQDHITAALAILVHSREIKSEEIKTMLSEKSNHHWREGMPHPKNDLILMRFATNGDKKITKKQLENKYKNRNHDPHNVDCSSKNPWGDLCKSWGVYDHQEVFQRKLPKNDYEDEIDENNKVVQIKNKKLAMRLGKRTYESEDSNSDSEWKKKSKTPRMRMHADDEETKQKSKQPVQLSRQESEEKESYAPLSIEVINSHSSYIPREPTKLSDKFRSNKNNVNLQKDSIQSRLGVKVNSQDHLDYSDETSSDSADYNIMSRVQKVSSKSKNEGSVWSRLETKQSKSSKNDLRQILKSRKHDDLRDRIGKMKQSNLRIEIDNTYSK
ncbi:nuclear cap-binding protein subunit 3-like isoform X2 [Achroia grisella]|uniref:nuclear cap-binding protein subunit 3-like isoform X2 n=1 Tax=Achroia grisella TaxID=688607 RepID=UPI0027D33B21|nr:nuclear cap-binding protein subunit 3-like isoform X2 [Achroia grisella]